jgi:hypothetical protein
MSQASNLGPSKALTYEKLLFPIPPDLLINLKELLVNANKELWRTDFFLIVFFSQNIPRAQHISLNL